MYNLPEFPPTPDSFAKKVQQAVKEGMEGENMRKRGNGKIITTGWKKKAAAAAITLTLIGAGGFTVYAVANSALKARMENMPQEEKKKKAKQMVEESGGLDEEGAREKASQWLYTLYGKTGENMEVSAYVDTNGTGTPEDPVYEVTFNIAGVEMYNFSLKASDGELCGAAYSGQEVQMGEMPVSDLESKADSLKETAEKYLRDSFGILENCQEVYYAYSVTEGRDTVIMNMVTFQFLMENDRVYIISLDGESGILELFKSRSMEEYQKSLETDKELREKGVVTSETVKKKIK